MEKSLGLLAACLLAAAMTTVTTSASADETLPGDDNDPQADPELASIAEPPPQTPGKVPANKGFQMALGAGYGIPFGEVDFSMDQSEFMSGQIPLILDIGYKSTPSLYIGGYVGVGFGQAGTTTKILCNEPGVDCSFTTLRFGVNFQYHMMPNEKINPYIGYGLGYESATFTATGPGGTGEISVSGFELARVGLGFDYRANATVGFGPYLDCGLGTYTRLSDGVRSFDVQDFKTHGWLNLGVRVVLFP